MARALPLAATRPSALESLKALLGVGVGVICARSWGVFCGGEHLGALAKDNVDGGGTTALEIGLELAPCTIMQPGGSLGLPGPSSAKGSISSEGEDKA